MSAFNNNNTNLNNTTAGIEARGSQLNNVHSGTTPNHNNIEAAYQRTQAPQSADLNSGNNLNDTYNHFQTGQPGASLNENHGIAATGLNEPHTHATVSPIHGDNNDLNNKIEQHKKYGNTAGQDLNSETNRTAGTGIPPVNTAEHVRQNQAEEAIIASEQNNHTHTNNETTHKNNTAPLGDHGASHHDKKDGGVGHNERAAAKENEHKNGGLTDNAHNPERKVSAGDKIKGNIEKVVGKITGNEEKVIKGENLAHGRAV